MFQTTFALVVFLFPLAYSPGPGNMFFAANGAQFGFRSTLPANTGYHLATWIVTVGIGFGFMAIFDRFPHALSAVKVAGALYVFWLAWKLIRAGTTTGGDTAKPATFGDGIILLVLNPKGYVIITLMFSQFLGAFDAGRFHAVLLISSVFTLNNLIAFMAWSLVGDKIAVYFRSPGNAQKLNLMFGCVLAAVAGWMLFA